MCEGGQVGIYVNVEVGKEEHHMNTWDAANSTSCDITGRILNVHSLVCGVEEGDVPDGKNALIELHQLG